LLEKEWEKISIRGGEIVMIRRMVWERGSEDEKELTQHSTSVTLRLEGLNY